VARALDAFFNKKEARLHRDRRGMVAVDIGCQEAGTLLVSLSLGIGVGESVHATYRVDEKRAPPIVDGPALAHADLDGDGQRDVVWTTPDGHLAVRFADRTLTTPLKVPESEDTDFFFAGAPALERAFALVIAYRAFNGTSEIKERARWDGKQFVSVDRLDEAFEAKYESARGRELAVLDDAMFGGFGQLRGELERCANTIGPSCTAVFDKTVSLLTKGGVSYPDARAGLRSFLGWHTCSLEK
jgi:hypothetical protein